MEINNTIKEILNIYYSQRIDVKFPYINIETNYNKISIAIYDNYHGYMLGKYMYITISKNDEDSLVLRTLLNRYDLNLDCIRYKDEVMTEDKILELVTNNLIYLYKGGK